MTKLAHAGLFGTLASLPIACPALAQGMASELGFASPQAALQALRSRADIQFSERDGWIVATDMKNQTVWLFDHPSDPTYPTVVKRSPVQTRKGWVIGSKILCGGPQSACDKVAAAFR